MRHMCVFCKRTTEAFAIFSSMLPFAARALGLRCLAKLCVARARHLEQGDMSFVACLSCNTFGEKQGYKEGS